MARDNPHYLAQMIGTALHDATAGQPVKVRLHTSALVEEYTGPAGPVGEFAQELAAAAGAAPLDQALAGLRAVAQALGIFEQTWQAQSVAEVGNMLVAEIARRDTQAAPATGNAPWHWRYPGAPQPPVPPGDPEAVGVRVTTWAYRRLAAGWRINARHRLEQAGTYPPSEAEQARYHVGYSDAMSDCADALDTTTTGGTQ